MAAHEGAGPEPPSPLSSDVPSAARMYDYYLGGRDNYESDREAVEKLLLVHPQAVEVAQNNRAFLNRAVSYLAEAGIEQFIDVGAGIPVAPYVHELVRAVRPAGRVVYVDNDPVVLAHDRALLAAEPGTDVLDADMHEPDAILTAPETCRLIDFSQPVAVLFIGVFEFSPGKEPLRILRAFREAMVPGSYLVASHLSTEGVTAHDVAIVKEAYSRTPTGIEVRHRDDIAALFDGFEMVSPGLVDVGQWRDSGRPTYGQFTGGVGRWDGSGASGSATPR